MEEVEEAKALLKENGVRQVLCAFTDLRGYLQMFSIPAREFVEGSAFENGIGFDGSSVRGFRTIEKSDMVWKPDASTLRVIPWIDDPIQKSAIMFGYVHDAWGNEIADCDPRGYVAKRAEDKLKSDGMSAVFGPEIEFFLFEGIDFTRLSWDMYVSPNGGLVIAGGRRGLCHSALNLRAVTSSDQRRVTSDPHLKIQRLSTETSWFTIWSSLALI